jgi:hypothetical protein
MMEGRMKTLLLAGLLTGALAAAAAVPATPAWSQGVAAVKKHNVHTQRSEKQSARPETMYYPPPPDGVPDPHTDPWRDVHAQPETPAPAK